jgi:hypothetical protein
MYESRITTMQGRISLDIKITNKSLEDVTQFKKPYLLKIVTIQNSFSFHCFSVHFDSLSFIHTNSCTFSYNHVLVF